MLMFKTVQSDQTRVAQSVRRLATSCTINESAFDSSQESEFIFLLGIQTYCGSHPQWIPGALFLRVKRPGREARAHFLFNYNVNRKNYVLSLPNVKFVLCFS
jgi:hypothetical protein